MFNYNILIDKYDYAAQQNLISQIFNFLVKNISK